MALFYPDISNYENGIPITGMKAVVIKATEGTSYTSPDYDRASADARAAGIPWAAYHFLHHNSDPAAQARYFHSVAGNVPAMLDVETAGDGSKATVGDALAFEKQLRALGGRVVLCYLPHWYWQELGSPDLTPLGTVGMHLVSSNYTTYSDTGPGWKPYGGMTPTVWQCSSTHSFNGFTVDWNAYNGTQDEFRNLLEESTMADSDIPETNRTAHNADTYAWHFTQLDPTIPGILGADGKPMTLPNNAAAAIKAIQSQSASNGSGISELKAAVAAISAPPAVSVDAAELAAHLDYNALAAAIAAHIKVQ